MSAKSLEDLREFVSLYRQMDDIAKAIVNRKTALSEAKEAQFKLRRKNADNIVVKTVNSYIQHLESEIKELENHIVYICDLSFCKDIPNVIPIQYRYDTALSFIEEEYAMGYHESITEAVQVWEKIIESEKIDTNTLQKIEESKTTAQLREDIIIPLRQEMGDKDIETHTFINREQEPSEEITEEKFSLKELFSQNRHLSCQ